MITLWHKFLRWLFPVNCCVCQKTGHYLCDHCFDVLSFYSSAPLESVAELDSVTVMARYQKPLSTVIQTAKFNQVAGIGPWLGELLYFHAGWPPVDLITAIPPDPHRLSQRGFHLPYQIGHRLSQLTGVPFHPLLTKPHSTTPQLSVPDPTRRQAHIAGAFSGLPPPDSVIPTQTRILLIDDVLTTGATLSEAAQVLRQTGFQTIHALAVAHGQ